MPRLDCYAQIASARCTQKRNRAFARSNITTTSARLGGAVFFFFFFEEPRVETCPSIDLVYLDCLRAIILHHLEVLKVSVKSHRRHV